MSSLKDQANLPAKNSRDRAKTLVLGLQDEICAGLETIDGEGKFLEESWERPEGGGGRSRVLKDGKIFEQGGVNFSEVHGNELPPSIISQRPEAKGHSWFATGTSMVLHPKSPYIPTVHLNYRYFEAGPVWWFGGGADLTPFYPYLSDTRHFHSCHKNACDTIDKDLHKVFKPWCDEYFFLKHRNETRGVGGIFYDYQDGSGLLYKGQNANGKASKISKELGNYSLNWENLFSLAKACGQAFLPSYEPIIAKRKNQKMINVFMPSTPNPTTGFLMFVPLSKCTKLNMSVDQAIKYIISAGLVTPKAPEIKKALPKKKKIKKLTK